VDGPSLTGGILERVPGVHRYGQYDWGRDHWEFRGSVFDGFAPATRPDGEPCRIVVTVGVNGYGFLRLFEAVKRAAPEGAQILWQTGTTDVSALGIPAVPMVPTEDLMTAMVEADVVVAHAGVGSAIMAMRAGKCPILVPRERAHHEHVDDHQREVARPLADAGLALTCDPAGLDGALVAEAARRRIVRNEYAHSFVLSEN
jgi:UDP-N-acetylglucosamine transferase subunit ALG13